MVDFTFWGFFLCHCIVYYLGNFTFWGFYFFKKKSIQKRPENFDYKIDGWWNSLDLFNIGKSWVCHMVEISVPISDYNVFLLIWTPASSVGVFFCKVKISQELVCELKEKSLKIKCFFASSIPHSVTYFWNKMKKKTFMIFHSFPPKFLTHISDFPAWFIFLNLLMSCSSLVWDFDRVNIGNPPTNCSTSDMSVGATFHIIQLLANYWFRQKLNMPYRPIMSVDRPKNAPSEESRLGSFFWIIQSVFYFTLKLQAGD